MKVLKFSGIKLIQRNNKANILELIFESARALLRLSWSNRVFGEDLVTRKWEITIITKLVRIRFLHFLLFYY